MQRRDALSPRAASLRAQADREIIGWLNDCRPWLEHAEEVLAAMHEDGLAAMRAQAVVRDGADLLLVGHQTMKRAGKMGASSATVVALAQAVRAVREARDTVESALMLIEAGRR
jgi:hypothetical protein